METFRTFIRSLVFATLATGGLVLVWQLATFRGLIAPRISIVQAANPIAEDSPSTFSFPKLRITAPLIIDSTLNPLVFKDWHRIREILYRGTLFIPSQVSDTPSGFIIGHSSDLLPHQYSGIFAGLGQANIGDHFEIKLDKTVYTYQVTDIKMLAPKDTDNFISLQKQNSITLITCWPLFTTRERLAITGAYTPISD